MKKDFYRVVGVMSGTSLDGIDLVLCEFQVEDTGNWAFQLFHPRTVAYNSEWKSRLSQAMHLDSEGVQTLNADYTAFLGGVIKKYIKENTIQSLDAVCSHGHTVFHQPENGFTLQIGNLSSLASEIGLPVVCDFRVQDVAYGGQGAPLVPIGDRLLFGDYEYCVNLGGFANISFEGKSGRIAHDICPVNVVLNALSNQLGKDYDAGGSLAAIGTLNQPLLERLNALDFYIKEPPKSLGMEWVNNEIDPILEEANLEPLTLLRTFTEHIAQQLAGATQGSGKVLVTGGGAYNDFLMERVRQLSQTQWVIPSPNLVEFKEALIFGLLGVLKLRNEVNCLSSVTGASKNHSSGRIFLP